MIEGAIGKRNHDRNESEASPQLTGALPSLLFATPVLTFASGPGGSAPNSAPRSILLISVRIEASRWLMPGSGMAGRSEAGGCPQAGTHLVGENAGQLLQRALQEGHQPRHVRAGRHEQPAANGGHIQEGVCTPQLHSQTTELRRLSVTTSVRVTNPFNDSLVILSSTSCRMSAAGKEPC